MRRVLVIGCGGAGKSTFSRALGARLGLPVTHLDRLYWQPGWQPTDDATWREIQGGLVAAESWVLAGNYAGSMDIRLAVADTAIFLDFPRWLCFTRAIRRTIASRRRDTQAPGCPDKMDREFIRYIWNFRTVSRPRVLAALAEHGKNTEQLILRSPREAQEYLARL